MDVDIRHGDKVEIDGVVWDVDGEPGHYVSPFTTRPWGVRVDLIRSEG